MPVLLLLVGLHDPSTNLVNMMYLIHYFTEVAFIKSLLKCELIWLFAVIKRFRTKILTNQYIASMQRSRLKKVIAFQFSYWMVVFGICYCIYPSQLIDTCAYTTIFIYINTHLRLQIQEFLLYLTYLVKENAESC